MVPRFVAALQEGGATVTRVAAYVTKQGVSSDDIMPEAALMRGGCIDAICFTSSAEAQGLVNALGGRDVLQALLADHGVSLHLQESFSVYRSRIAPHCGRWAQ